MGGAGGGAYAPSTSRRESRIEALATVGGGGGGGGGIGIDVNDNMTDVERSIKARIAKRDGIMRYVVVDDVCSGIKD
jgi:hypothetical protein